MRRNLICHDGKTCDVQSELNPHAFQEVEVLGVTLKKPILNCPGEKSRCTGTTIIDHGNCIEWCPLCFGHGWLRQELPIEHGSFGKMLPCDNKPISVSIEGTGLHRADLELSWEAMRQTETLFKIKTAILELIKQGHGSIYIHGPSGTGKTVSGKIAVLIILRARKRARFCGQPEMMNELRLSYTNQYDSNYEYSRRMNQLKGVKLLVIDEVARDQNTDLAIRSFSDLVNARHETGMFDTLTIYISNYTPEQALDEHQADRMRDARNQVIHVAGQSVRPAMVN